jgi:hypothetical protein
MRACSLLFPGRCAACNDALQTRDRQITCLGDPASAEQRFTLHRVRDTNLARRAN